MQSKKAVLSYIVGTVVLSILTACAAKKDGGKVKVNQVEETIALQSMLTRVYGSLADIQSPDNQAFAQTVMGADLEIPDSTQAIKRVRFIVQIKDLDFPFIFEGNYREATEKSNLTASTETAAFAERSKSVLTASIFCQSQTCKNVIAEVTQSTKELTRKVVFVFSNQSKVKAADVGAKRARSEVTESYKALKLIWSTSPNPEKDFRAGTKASVNEARATMGRPKIKIKSEKADTAQPKPTSTAEPEPTDAKPATSEIEITVGDDQTRSIISDGSQTEEVDPLRPVQGEVK